METPEDDLRGLRVESLEVMHLSAQKSELFALLRTGHWSTVVSPAAALLFERCVVQLLMKSVVFEQHSFLLRGGVDLEGDFS